MRLKTFITNKINEKVSRDEKKDALKNKNILIGCEFEFKLDEPLGISQYEKDLYERALADYNNYNEEVDEYNDAYQDYIDETEEMKSKIEEIEDEISETEEAISNSESSIDEYNDEIKSIQNDVERGLWSPPNKTVYGKEITSSKEEIDIIKKKIDKEQDDIIDWEKELKDLNNKLDSMQSDVKYREEEGKYEEIDHPYIDSGMFSDYMAYMTEYMGVNRGDIISNNPGEHLQYQPYYEDYYDSSNFIDIIENSGILNDAPFNHFEVGGYDTVEQEVGSTTWAVEEDSTVTGDEGVAGMEIANPPMELPKFVPNKLIDMFDWIDEIGYTDSSCGFHVHMSLKNNKYPIDKLKLLLFTEEDYVYNIFSERRNNSYVNSIKNKLKSNGLLDDKQIQDTFDINKISVKLMSAHMDGVNILDTENGHVEFRYMGGDNYHRKEKEVIDTIASYAYWLSLAADPDYKKKEYIHKVIRILNKSKMYEYYIILSLLKNVIKKDDIHEITKIKARTLYDEFYKKYKKYNDYKVEKKTLDLLFDNYGFMTPILKKYNKLIKRHFHKDDIEEADMYHARLSTSVSIWIKL